MSSTPEISRSIKFSPYGKPIRKTLLTPCRPMGLSRKRKTPKSTSKILPKSVSGIFECLSSSVTPVNSETIVESPIISLTPGSKKTRNRKFTAKKCLQNNFGSLSEEKEHLNGENISESPVSENGIEVSEKDTVVSTSLVNEVKNIEISLKRVSQDEILSHSRKCKRIVSDDESAEIFSLKKRQHVILSDDEDFQCFPSISQKSVNNEYKNEKLLDSGRVNINIGVDITNNVPSSDEEDFVKTVNTKKLILMRKESIDKKSEKTSSRILKPKKSMTVSLSMLEDEDDAFTSTPEREKTEKVLLIEKIKNLENDVKKKKRKLEGLKQAQIYQMKHNIEELSLLTQKWRDGCVGALNDLLVKLQSHGPMNMTNLMNNLQISNELAQKLKLVVKDKDLEEGD